MAVADVASGELNHYRMHFTTRRVPCLTVKKRRVQGLTDSAGRSSTCNGERVPG